MKRLTLTSAGSISLLLLLAWGPWAACGSTDPDTECDRTDYEIAAEHHVKRQLVSPASADFNLAGPQSLQFNGDTANYVNWVDSENRFGAKMRLYFKVWMRCRNGKVEILDAAYEGG